MKKVIFSIILFLIQLQCLSSYEIFKQIKSDGGRIVKARYSTDYKKFLIIQGRTIKVYNTEDWSLINKITLPDSIYKFVDRSNRNPGDLFDATIDGTKLYIIKLGKEYYINFLLTYSLPDLTLLSSQELIFNESNESVHKNLYSLKLLFGDEEIQIDNRVQFQTSDGYIEYKDGDIQGKRADDKRYIIFHEYNKHSKYGDRNFSINYIIDNYGEYVGNVTTKYIYHPATLDSLDNGIIYDYDTVIYVNRKTEVEKFTKLFKADGYLYFNYIRDMILLDDFNMFVGNAKTSLLFFDSKSFYIYDKYKKDSAITFYFFNKNNSTLTLTDADGNIDVLKIGNYAKLSADFIADKDTINQFDNVSFSAKYQDEEASYRWDFGDGSTGNGSRPVHKYSKTGVYTVTLKVELKGELAYKEEINLILVKGLELDPNSNFKILWGKNSDQPPNPAWFRYSDDGTNIALINNKNDVLIISSNDGHNIYSDTISGNYKVVTSANNDNLLIVQEPKDQEGYGEKLIIKQKSFVDNFSKGNDTIILDLCGIAGISWTENIMSYYLLPFKPILIVVERIYCQSRYNQDEKINQIFQYNYDTGKFNNTFDKFYFRKMIGFESMICLNSFNKFNNSILIHYEQKIFQLDLQTRENKLLTSDSVNVENISRNNEIEFLDKSGNMLLTHYSDLHNLLYYDSASDSIHLENIFDGKIKKMAYFPQSKNVFIIFEDGRFCLYSLSNHLIIDSIKFSAKFIDLCISPTGNEFALLTEEGIIYTFRLKDTQVTENKSNYLIYPNPSSGYIDVIISNPLFQTSEIGNIRIYDFLGIEHFSSGSLSYSNTGEKQVRLDVSQLLPGVYFVRIWNEVRKFVKL